MKSFYIYLTSLLLIGCVKYDEGLPLRKQAVNAKIIKDWNVTRLMYDGYDRLDYRPYPKFAPPCNGQYGTWDDRRLSREFTWQFLPDGTWKATNVFRSTWNTFVGYDENGHCLWEAHASDGYKVYGGYWEVDDHKDQITIQDTLYGTRKFQIIKLSNNELSLYSEYPRIYLTLSR